MRTLALASLLLITSAALLAINASHKGEAAPVLRASQAQMPGAQPTPEDAVRRVTIAELRAALEKGTAIAVDVRGEEQYRAGHIKGALWIPSDEIARRTKELPKDKLIVTYCS